MNTETYLKSQGWLGTGHSLDAHTTARGISRPLLVSKKQDVLGLGNKKHNHADQWWMNAFDKSLQSLDTSKKSATGEVQVTQTVKDSALSQAAEKGKVGGWMIEGAQLYKNFVKGEGLQGTYTPPSTTTTSADDSAIDVKMDTKAKRKRDDDDDGRESKAERRQRRAAKKLARAAKQQAKAEKLALKLEGKKTFVETKQERRARKSARKSRKLKVTQGGVKEGRHHERSAD
jgi:nucleolar protein TMA23